MVKSLIIWLGLAIPVLAASLDELTFITEQYPPFNYERDGEVQGLSVAVFAALLQHTGSTMTTADVQVLPWARGYETVQARPNTVLFSTIRTEARESLFKWVGPITPDRIVLLARQGQDIELPSIAHLNESNLKTVVIRRDIGEQRLQEAGVNPERIRTASANRSALDMLAQGRVDLWAYGEEAAYWLAAENGYAAEDFKAVYVLSEDHLYFALHPDTDDALVAAMQSALDELHANGAIADIMRR